MQRDANEAASDEVSHPPATSSGVAVITSGSLIQPISAVYPQSTSVHQYIISAVQPNVAASIHNGQTLHTVQPSVTRPQNVIGE